MTSPTLYLAPLARPSLATATAFVLAFAAGAIADAAFLSLTSTMTLAGATVAVLAFAGSLLIGSRLTAAGRRRPAPALPWASGLILAAALVAGIATAGAGAGPRLLVIALSAGALAFQFAGARRITELPRVPSPDSHVWRHIGSIPTLVAGAVTGLAIVTATPAAAPPISAAAAITAIVLVRRVDLHRR